MGMSKPDYIKIDVLYAPSILSVGPTSIIAARVNSQATLTCEAEGNPEPEYQWMQKLPTSEVLIRGYEKELVIDSATYDHQGEFVCKAFNTINNEHRSVQSKPIRVEVSGEPQIVPYPLAREVIVQSGEDAKLEVKFCANPQPELAWSLHDAGVGRDIELTAGSIEGRFAAEEIKRADREDCFWATLRINGAHPDDSHGYRLTLRNQHGHDSHVVQLKVGSK